MEGGGLQEAVPHYASRCVFSILHDSARCLRLWAEAPVQLPLLAKWNRWQNQWGNCDPQQPTAPCACSELGREVGGRWCHCALPSPAPHPPGAKEQPHKAALRGEIQRPTRPPPPSRYVWAVRLLALSPGKLPGRLRAVLATTPQGGCRRARKGGHPSDQRPRASSLGRDATGGWGF